MFKKVAMATVIAVSALSLTACGSGKIDGKWEVTDSEQMKEAKMKEFTLEVKKDSCVISMTAETSKGRTDSSTVDCTVDRKAKTISFADETFPYSFDNKKTLRIKDPDIKDDLVMKRVKK